MDKAQPVKCLPCKYRVWIWSPEPTKKKKEKKSQMLWTHLYPSPGEAEKWRVPGVHWPDIRAYWSSPRFRERLYLKKQGGWLWRNTTCDEKYFFPFFFSSRKINHSKEIKSRLSAFIYVHSDVTEDRLGKSCLVATPVQCFQPADAVDGTTLKYERQRDTERQWESEEFWVFITFVFSTIYLIVGLYNLIFK